MKRLVSVALALFVVTAAGLFVVSGCRNSGKDGKIVFTTSSYHVFRSGLWARQAGLSAEGLGSRTKWWFWPNAFMRETAGLLQKRWKQELLFLLLLIVFFGILSMIL